MRLSSIYLSQVDSNDQANSIAYLGGTWKRRRTGFEGMCPYQMDCAASEMMEKWKNQHLKRRDELVKVLIRY